MSPNTAALESTTEAGAIVLLSMSTPSRKNETRELSSACILQQIRQVSFRSLTGSKSNEGAPTYFSSLLSHSASTSSPPRLVPNETELMLAPRTLRLPVSRPPSPARPPPSSSSSSASCTPSKKSSSPSSSSYSAPLSFFERNDRVRLKEDDGK
jgi:hypothetical protein